MSKDLVIFGAGGLGRVVCQLVRDVNAQAATWNLLGFLDSDVTRHGKEVEGLPVLGGAEWLRRWPETWVLTAVGMSEARRCVVRETWKICTPHWATLIHPRAWLPDSVDVGAGSIIYPSVLVDPHVSIGRHVILNKACTIGHDAVLEDFVTVNPGVNVGGGVRLGEGCFLGIGSATLQEITIGDWTIVGAGSVVIADLPPHVTAVGCPSRIVKQHKS